MQHKKITGNERWEFLAHEETEPSLTENDRLYVETSRRDNYALCKCIGVYTQNGALFGYAVVPCNDRTHLLRLYIGVRYRRAGAGGYLLDVLGIKELCCLKNNEIALSLYKKMGFVPVHTEWTRVVKLQR